MSVQTLTLADTFERLKALSSYINLQIGQPTGDGWYSHSDLARSDSPHLATLLERIRTKIGCDDRQFGATAFISSYSWQMTAASIGCYFTARRVPDLSPDNLRMHFDDNVWHDQLAFLEGRFYALPDDPEAGQPHVTVVENMDALRDEMRLQTEAHLADVIGALKLKTGMGKRGLWGLVADRLAGNLIYACQVLGQPERCRSELDALIHVPGSHLNGKTDVMTFEHAGHREQFLTRGACCQYYKAPGYGYCATCPLQKPEERERRMREHLEQHHHD
ncbi:MAG: (2Fe-2S)-binding protein [Anaerolineae bacterium]|nr:(2Fe-2S)-binding protein [Anaerolineae bacterium]